MTACPHDWARPGAARSSARPLTRPLIRSLIRSPARSPARPSSHRCTFYLDGETARRLLSSTNDRVLSARQVCRGAQHSALDDAAHRGPVHGQRRRSRAVAQLLPERCPRPRAVFGRVGGGRRRGQAHLTTCERVRTHRITSANQHPVRTGKKDFLKKEKGANASAPPATHGGGMPVVGT